MSIIRAFIDAVQRDLSMNFDAIQSHAGDVAQLMKALTNENRLMLLCTPWAGERSVGQLYERSSRSQSALSQHVTVLRRDALVTARREAQTIFQWLAEGSATKFIEPLHDLCCGDH